MTEERGRASRPAEREQVRLFGAPRPERFTDTPMGQALARSARIHYTEEADRNRLLAIEKLALDVLQDSLAARAFATNPEEYMRRAGFPDVRLNLNSEDVRVAMAMGDPDVRAAVVQRDVEGFIDALLAQGIRSDPKLEQSLVFGIELAVYFSAAVVSWVAVAYTVGAAISLETAIGVHHKVAVSGADASFLTVEHHKNLLAQLADHLGDPGFARHVRSASMDRIVREYVELQRRTVEEAGEELPEEGEETPRHDEGEEMPG
jgi:hypothetical protein